jgi:hypothetical protein
MITLQRRSDWKEIELHHSQFVLLENKFVHIKVTYFPNRDSNEPITDLFIDSYDEVMARITEDINSERWPDSIIIPRPKKSSDGDFIKDCVLFRSSSRESRIIGACLWGFFLLWLAGMTFVFWAASNQCIDQV